MIILDEQETSQQRSSEVAKNRDNTSTSPTSSLPPPPPYIPAGPNSSSSSYPYAHHQHHTTHTHHTHHTHHSLPTSPTHSPTTVVHTTSSAENHALVVHYRIQEQAIETRTIKRFFIAFSIALVVLSLSTTFIRALLWL